MASPPLLEGDVMEVRINGHLYGQRVMNVLHYDCSLVVGNPTFDVTVDAFDLLLNAAGSLFPRIRAGQVGDAAWDFVDYQRVHPNRTYYIRKPHSEPGSLANPALPTQDSAEIVKQNAVSGRGHAGKFFVWGVPVSAVNEDAIVPDYGTILEDIGTAIRDNHTIVGGGLTMVPIIWSRLKPNDRHQIAATHFNPSIRSLHRRVFGKGI
jgi:hypothetical protein